MFRLIRLIAAASGVYFFYSVGFPHGSGTAYSMVSGLIIVGGIFATFFLIKIIDVGEGILTFGIEALFVVVVALYLGFSWPQSRGASPIMQMWRGEHPTQTQARDGFEKLGINPNGTAANFVISLFPKH